MHAIPRSKMDSGSEGVGIDVWDGVALWVGGWA